MQSSLSRDRVTDHAKKVVEHKVISCRYHYLACKRHLENLKKQRTKDFPYYWDINASERILEFAETLIIADGKEPKPVKLIEEQAFDIGSRFGWKKLNGFRRFRRSYISKARQNGKSIENGILGTYISGFSGYHYGKLFTVATKKRQARIAWEAMAKFIESDKDLSEMFDIKDYKSMIVSKQTKSTIEALSKESGLDDGFQSIFSSIDELHQHTSNKIYKTIYDGTVALDETLVSMITTRGEKQNSFCYDMDSYAINILEGTNTAEDFFADIYCLDKGDDIFDESNYIKANPYLASTEKGIETLHVDAETAKDMGGDELRDFMIKRLNLWTNNTDNSFVELEKWKACGSNKTLDDVVLVDGYRDCYIGFDLSSGGDLTSIAIEIPRGESFYIYSHSFMPKGRLEEHIKTDIAPYDVWESQELLTVMGSSDEYKNDYKFIIKHLHELIDKYELNVKGIGYDPHNADTFLTDLEEFGAPLLMITQSARFLNDGTEDMQLNIKSGKVEYNQKNELLSWSVSNAKIVKNSFDEKKVDKEPHAKYKRIDVVDAIIDAHIAYMKLQEDDNKVNLEEEMNKYLEQMSWN